MIDIPLWLNDMLDLMPCTMFARSFTIFDVLLDIFSFMLYYPICCFIRRDVVLGNVE